MAVRKPKWLAEFPKRTKAKRRDLEKIVFLVAVDPNHNERQAFEASDPTHWQGHIVLGLKRLNEVGAWLHHHTHVEMSYTNPFVRAWVLDDDGFLRCLGSYQKGAADRRYSIDESQRYPTTDGWNVDDVAEWFDDNVYFVHNTRGR